jgi:hypothetical protein
MATVDRKKGSPRIITPNPISADLLGIANAVGIWVLVFALSAIVFLFLHSSFRSSASQNETRQLVRVLSLNSLSLVPSGRPLRNPDAFQRAIDLRFDPKLGRIHSNSTDLLLKMPD